MGVRGPVPDADEGAHPAAAVPPPEVFNGLRYAVCVGEVLRMMPNDLRRGSVIYWQTRRWMAAGVFKGNVQHLP